MNNYYDILGLKSNASPEQIKQVYRNLAKKYHPDNKKTGDSQKFIKINEAYEKIINQKFNKIDKLISNPDLDTFSNIKISIKDAFNGILNIPIIVNNKQIYISVPKFLYKGNDLLVIKGKGRQRGNEVGDAYINVIIDTFDNFRLEYRENKPILVKTIYISPIKAIIGGEIIFTDLENKEEKIFIKKGLKNKSRVIIKNKGWKVLSNKRTDLEIEIIIDNKEYNLTDDEINYLMFLEKKYGK